MCGKKSSGRWRSITFRCWRWKSRERNLSKMYSLRLPRKEVHSNVCRIEKKIPVVFPECESAGLFCGSPYGFVRVVFMYICHQKKIFQICISRLVSSASHFFISLFISHFLFIFLRCIFVLLKREVRHLQIPFLSTSTLKLAKIFASFTSLPERSSK